MGQRLVLARFPGKESQTDVKALRAEIEFLHRLCMTLFMSLSILFETGTQHLGSLNILPEDDSVSKTFDVSYFLTF